jgi:hypothetical protein
LRPIGARRQLAQGQPLRLPLRDMRHGVKSAAPALSPHARVNARARIDKG